MPTDKQIAANRRNAQKSTGPRTEEGKNKTRLNAWKHGLTGHLEAPADPLRDAFIADILAGLKPADAIERQLANSIADGYWRINRVSAVETNLIAGDDDDDDDDDILRTMNLLTTYEMRLHRKVKSDLDQLRKIQAARRAEEAKNTEQEQAATRRTFDEACALLELNIRQDDQLDLHGDFTHPNGSVYSIPKLLDAMATDRRCQRAKRNLITDPFTSDQLARLLSV
jgi:hypothetical protein